MSDATPLPRVGEVFFDDRGDDRALRLSWHPDAAVMVLSIWNRGVCTGTFRLPARDIPTLLEALGQGIPQPAPRGRRHAEAPETVADPPAHSALPAYDGPPAAGNPYESVGRYDSAHAYDGPLGNPYGQPPAAASPQFPATGQYATGAPAANDPLDILKSLSASTPAEEDPLGGGRPRPFPRTGEYRKP